ncbi:MAG: DNA polymerase IV [Spirochaetales bacterium]|uniref:DNA polymerase IV n=1 Tax=Candidatus Thalassospirochaeta sargassi TaxID=3119039 RepID=A0AAJ1IKT3_9SPIO|nr:DNA polymerase IV [Spirochaetales bacterium]
MKNKPEFSTRILHVDLDAFYAAVEQHKNPDLQGKPVVIGASPGKRGVVSACSYEARKYGVHSAMPISIARRLCPEAVFLPVRMRLYQAVSAEIMEIFTAFTPDICQISIDEAFLDMTGTDRLFGSIEETGMLIKKTVKEKTGLTISIGAAESRFLAKLASDFGKPDGLHVVEKGSELDFLDQLELKDIWGLGKKTLERLNDLNITTVKGLRDFSENSLKTIFGQSAGGFLFRACRGIDIGMYNTPAKSNSISNETTFQQDINDRDVLERVLLELSHHVMFRTLKENKKSKSIAVKLRFSDFSSTTAQKTLSHYIHSAEEIYSISIELLNSRWNGSSSIRLIGTGLLALEDGDKPEQPELFENEFERKIKVEKAVFRLKTQGEKITKASLLNNKIKPKKE